MENDKKQQYALLYGMCLHIQYMFTIEHEFDATVVTLIDDVAEHREEDVTISLTEDGATVLQYDPDTGVVKEITLSMAQLQDLRMSVNMPEGAYTKVSTLSSG